jgi:hypothetical protein
MKKIKQIEKIQAQYIRLIAKGYRSLKKATENGNYHFPKNVRVMINGRKGYNPITAGIAVRTFSDAKLSSIYRELRSEDRVSGFYRIEPNFHSTKVCLCKHVFGEVNGGPVFG